jgi:1,4-dihydroxy-6-naphthoate synthase
VERLEDVETLNRMVRAAALDVSKVSYHLFGHVRDHYCLLRSGGALGRGCGPLLVSTGYCEPDALRGKPIAVPGEYTTACLLVRLFDPRLRNLVFMPFHEIISSVAAGKVSAGVIIHESRFTYEKTGLVKILDLGEWWENSTGFPIPLGGIVAKRSLGWDMVTEIDRAVGESVAYARRHPEACRDYVRSHAREMSDDVCDAHIGLYVNDFSCDLGEEGAAAIHYLFSRAEAAGAIPPSSHDIFMEHT